MNSNSLSECNLDIIVRCFQSTQMYDLCSNKWHCWHSVLMPPHPFLSVHPTIRALANKWQMNNTCSLLKATSRVKSSRKLYTGNWSFWFVPLDWRFPLCRLLFVYEEAVGKWQNTKWPKDQRSARLSCRADKVSIYSLRFECQASDYIFVYYIFCYTSSLSLFLVWEVATSLLFTPLQLLFFM